jgi:hypothetical protein
LWWILPVKKTKFDMQVFGAVLVYEKRALSRYRKLSAAQPKLEHGEPLQAKTKQERSETAPLLPQTESLELQTKAQQRYEALPPAVLQAYRQRVEEQIKARVGERFDWMWDEGVREATIKANILRLIVEEEDLLG